MHAEIGVRYEDGDCQGQRRQHVPVGRSVDDLGARYNAVQMWWGHILRTAAPAAPGIPTSTLSARFFHAPANRCE